jgi:DNA-binding response OmpR family regulator
MAALLAGLLAAPAEGASAEHLFYEVWGGREYHPLVHRNTIYVAIGRLRQALRELLPGREIIKTAASGWRLAADLDLCVIRPRREFASKKAQTVQPVVLAE